MNGKHWTQLINQLAPLYQGMLLSALENTDARILDHGGGQGEAGLSDSFEWELW